VSIRFKEELDKAETNKTLLSGEMHRLELECVRLEHECRSADQECERLTQAVQALGLEQAELTKDIGILNDEIRRGKESAEARITEKNEREQQLAQKQAAAAALKNGAETAEAAVTQSRIIRKTREYPPES